MVAATWGVFAVLALLWTGGAAMGAALAGWTAEAIATGTAGAAAREIAALPVPQWIGVWSDNFKAQALYKAYGFERVGEYKFPVGKTLDDEFILRRRP